MNAGNILLNITGNNDCATSRADFNMIHEWLRTDKQWVAEVLNKSGDYPWRVSSARWSNKGIFGGSLVDSCQDSFIIWGAIDKRTYLAFQIERDGNDNITITPVAYLPRSWKIATAVGLAIIFVAPVLLAPFFWWIYQKKAWRNSRLYLPAFCQYLLDFQEGENPFSQPETK